MHPKYQTKIERSAEECREEAEPGDLGSKQAGTFHQLPLGGKLDCETLPLLVIRTHLSPVR